MLLDDYQKQAAWTCLEQCYNKEYLFSGLVSELGELADIYKKDIRGDGPAQTKDIMNELGDVLWYLAMLCGWYGLSLDAVAQQNLRKLSHRKETDTIKNLGERNE